MSGNKKSKDVGEHAYKLGDVVLAKIRGYPRWPGMVVDPEAVPPAVTKERPGSKKTSFYCVRFFPAGDYSWLVSKDLSLLQKHEIESYINEPHKKSGDLLQGYKIALDPTEWADNLDEQRAAYEEAEADAEVDQLQDGDEDEDADTKKPKAASKKRKRESEPKPKKKKEPKKSASAESKDKKGSAKKSSAKKNGIRSKETIESEDDGGDDAEGEDAPAESSKRPAAKRAKKDKGGDDGNFDHLANNSDAAKVKEWRHKLQRAFLSKSVPKEEEMPEYDQLFTTIENHDLTIEQLSFSKLGKVMRHIAQLDQTKFPIPNEDEYTIRRRAEILLDKWQGLIAASGDTGNPSAVNGTSKVVKDEKAENVKADMEVDKAKSEAPVNGAATDAAKDASADPSVPPAAEEDVPMDTADD